MAQGNPADARVALEKALRYKPRNQRARNLLGLSLFKLGELPRSEEIYRALIEDHPSDPTLRVNLGLVFLKQNASPRCGALSSRRRWTSRPTTRRRRTTSGWRWRRRASLARAREWFLRAGNDAMAERMTEGLKTSPLRAVAESAAAALAGDQPFRAAVDEAQPKLETAKIAPEARWVAT